MAQEVWGEGCECWVTPESTWFRYGSAIEPGSMVEPNPDCPQHRTPYRIQRRRTKGWRLPANTVYVGRGSRWGSPFRVGIGDVNDADRAVQWFTNWLTNAVDAEGRYVHGGTDYHGAESSQRPPVEAIRFELRGMNLACWCPLDQPCHADVLLKLANKEAE